MNDDIKINFAEAATKWVHGYFGYDDDVHVIIQDSFEAGAKYAYEEGYTQGRIDEKGEHTSDKVSKYMLEAINLSKENEKLCNALEEIRNRIVKDQLYEDFLMTIGSIVRKALKR